MYLEFVGDEETAERLKKLQQRLVNIDDCAKLINLALAKKYKLYMSHFENVAADVDCYDNKITLSPHLSDEELTYALLHSLRHVWQLDKDMPDFSKLNIFSYMMLNRILEADASAYACKMLWDLKEKEGSNSEWNLWLDRNNLFVKYQEEILKENENKTKEALKTAFLAWFTDDDAKDKYDYNYIKDSLENIGEAMSDFSTDVAVDDILKMFCVDLGDDVNYIDDKDFTNESAHIDMNEETFNFVKSWFNKRYYLNNTEIDASLDKIIKRKMLWQTSGSVGIGEEIISPEVDMIIEGDDKEKSLLARAINRICKSPVGIGIIKDVALAKYAFRLDDEIKDRFKINLGAKKISFAKGYNEEILMIDT